MHLIFPTMDTTKLKLNTIIALKSALESLDGFVRDGKLSPYNLTGKVRYSVTKNLNILKREIAEYDETRIALIRQISGGERIDEKDSEQLTRFRTELNSVLEAEQEVAGLFKIPVSQLLSAENDKNPIPATVLSELEPLLIDDFETAEKK
jgi:hypothetical protein